MRKNYFIRVMIIFAGLFLGLQNLSAQEMNIEGNAVRQEGSSYYVLWETGEIEIEYNHSHPYTLKGPGDLVSFEGLKTGLGSIGDFFLYADGREVKKWGAGDFERNTYKTYSNISLNSYTATTLKFDFPYGGSYSRKIKNVKVTMAKYLTLTSATELKFQDNTGADHYVGSDPSEEDITFDWCNTGDVNVSLSGDGASQYTVRIKNTSNQVTSLTDAGNVAFGSTAGKSGNAVIVVEYSHAQQGSHPATLTISGGGKTITISLQGKTIGYAQQINWWTTEEQPTLRVGDVLEYVAYVERGEMATVRVISSNPADVVSIDAKGKLTTIQPGTVTLEASHEGDETYAPVTDTKTIVVTDKYLQTIIWEQDLTGLIFEEAASAPTLNARSSVGLTPITYTSDNTDVAIVDENGKLVIVGLGTCTITATQAGGIVDGKEYVAATLTKKVIVSSNKRGCESYVYVQPFEGEDGGAEGDQLGGVGKPGRIEGPELELSGAADYVRFEAMCDGGEWNKRLILQEKVDDVWSDVDEVTVTDSWAYYTLPRPESTDTISEKATSLRLVKPGGSLGIYYEELKVYRKRFVRSDVTELTWEDPVLIGSPDTKTMTITYSHIPVALDVVLENGTHFFVDVQKIGTGCGQTGTQTIQVTFKPQSAGEINDVLIIRDTEGNEVPAISIPLSGTAIKNLADIDWNDPADYKTVDDITFTAMATGFRPATYTQTAGSEVATVDVNGKVTIHQAGQITVVANAAEDEKYYAAEPMERTFTIRLTKITEATVALSPIVQGDVITASTITGEAKDEVGNGVDGTWTFVEPNQVMNTCGENAVQVQFTPTKTNFYELVPYIVEATVMVNSPAWLTIMPDAGEVPPQADTYVNLLYAEGENGTHANVEATEDITITDNLYYMFRVTDVDDWRIFVPPFTVEKAYVIELIPETEDKAQMIDEQNAAYADLYAHLQTALTAHTTELDLVNIITAYKENSVFSIDGNDYYNAYKGAAQWEYDGEKLTKSWEQIVPSAMDAQGAYALQFPWCPMCERDNDWHYWTGKLILLQGAGPQTIASVAETPAANASGATLTGNYTLADMEVTNAFVHDTSDDLYKIQSSATIAPTQSFILANIPTKQGKRAVAITRQGDIIWEDDGTGNGNSGVVTDLEAMQASSLTVMSQTGGFSVVSSIAQAIQIYGINGSLIYAGEIGASEAQFFSVEAGMYIVRISIAAYKVCAR